MSRTRTSTTRIERVILLAVFLIALPGLVRWLELGDTHQSDTTGYFVAAIRLARGDHAIYSVWPGTNLPPEIPAIDLITLPYNYPPLLAVLLIPAVTTLTYQQLQTVWMALNGLAIAAALMVTVRALAIPLARREWLGLLAAALLFPPLFRTIRLGQIVGWLMLCSALALWGSNRRRETWVGAAIAFAALIKIYPALFGLAVLVRGRWRSVLWGLLAGAVLFALPGFVVGWDLYRSYVFERLPAFAEEPLADPASQSISSFLLRLGIGGPPLLWLTIALALAMLAATLWRMTRPAGWPALFALASVLMAVLPTRSWDFNYLMLLGPMAALYFSPLSSTPQSRCVLLLVYGLITLERYWPLYPNWWPLQSFSLYGALLLWGWLLRLTAVAPAEVT